jgi:uncharacterized protein YndB with AHSA1/START domain
MTASETRSLIIERELPHPPEKIWRALTQSSLIQQWLMQNDFQPTIGHRFNFRSTPVAGWDGVIDSEVLVVEPNKKLSYSWGTLGLGTVVTFTLTPTATGTQLHLEQSGFHADEERNFKGAKYGWQNFLNSLDQVVAKLD